MLVIVDDPIKGNGKYVALHHKINPDCYCFELSFLLDNVWNVCL